MKVDAGDVRGVGLWLNIAKHNKRNQRVTILQLKKEILYRVAEICKKW